MRILLSIVLGVILLLIGAAWWVSRPVFDTQFAVPPQAFEILPVTTAVTLATTRTGEVLLVTQADERGVLAVDVSQAYGQRFTDSLAALNQLGTSGLGALSASSKTSYAWDALGLPFKPTYPHIAAGTNFKAHMEEVGLDGEPFLFPKLSAPSTWNANVRSRTRLDYEAELCAVMLGDGQSNLGFVLCNDFTDRWALLRHIDLDQPMGLTGFPDAKGGSEMLPIGPLLVIPQSAESFVNRVSLQLGVNGMLRQQAAAALMIWSPTEIVDRALRACEQPYEHSNGDVYLTGCEAIPPGTLLLTGTPEGVLFNVLNIWAPQAYLSSGDEVATAASHLGMLRNRVE